VTALFFGLYRGEVAGNVDPMKRGRVQVSVPEVYGDGRLAWAEPCAGYAGDNVGSFAIPPVGAAGWIQFERGDPDYPVLAGLAWKDGQSPASGLEQEKVFKTGGIKVTVSDAPGGGGVTVEVGSPAVNTPIKFALTSSGIELSMGSSAIKLDGTKVTVNNGALEVM
jgi:Type VI secretion system/phage-baseplate injector OB domain